MENERRNQILTLIKQDKEVRLSDLTKLIPYVSEMTLRRDLDFLADKGLLMRTHGGGKEIKPSQIIDAFNFENRVSSNIVSKNNIASFAVKLLEAEKVACVPGTAFGPTGEGFLRCCFATSLDNIEEATKRMARFVKALK